MEVSVFQLLQALETACRQAAPEEGAWHYHRLIDFRQQRGSLTLSASTGGIVMEISLRAVPQSGSTAAYECDLTFAEAPPRTCLLLVPSASHLDSQVRKVMQLLTPVLSSPTLSPTTS